MNATKLQALRKKLNKWEFEKVYLDELSEFETVIKDWLESLSEPYEFYTEGVEQIDCRSRSGFIPNSWNHGGLDLEFRSDLRMCFGTGVVPNDYIQGEIDRMLDMAYEYAKEQGIDINTEDEKVRERIYEIEDSYLEVPVWLGVRCMYEGIENGIHTLKVYVGCNVSEYYGSHGKESKTLAEFEIRFRNASGLNRQLERITKKVENKL
jgi:hypothetical protein